MPGRYIALEGGEGCGKSTQASLLADALGAVRTREPGGTEVGLALRALLLDPASVLDARTEALLMAADRAQHAAEVVAPAVAEGRHVVSDRSVYSSIAYQGFGRGLGADPVRRVSEFALAGTWPDLVVLLRVPVEVADARLDRALDRMEQAGADFHARVRTGFDELAAAEPDRFVVVDGVGTVDEVAARVRAGVRDRLQLPL